MAKLYVIAGHGAGDCGAVGNGYQEAERVRALAQRIKDFGGANVILGDFNRNFYKDNGISKLTISKEYKIIELHMDSGASTARGGHIIIKEGFKADSYDNALAKLVGDIFPGRSNKIVGRSNLANVNRAAKKGYNYRLMECGFISDNALAKLVGDIFPGRSNKIVGRSNLANVNRAAKKGYNYRLMECGFISNVEDVKIFNTRMDEFAKGILSCFGIGSVNTTPTPLPAPTPQSKPTQKPSTPTVKDYLQKGDKGSTVKEMQKMLIVCGYSCGKYGADSVFGNDAEKAVEKFQIDNGLSVDGVYGKNTKAKLVAKYKKVKLDGIWGYGVTVSLQTIFKTVIDGEISRQPHSNKKYLVACHTSTWNFTNNYKNGSVVLKQLQIKINANPDGLFGENSIIALQNWLNKNGYACGKTDGYLGAKTVIALQKWILDTL